MANYTKREQNRADIAGMIEAGIAPPKPKPLLCHCGELARFEVNRFSRIDFYCDRHLPADALGEHKR